jgi:DNA polymerase I
VLVADFETEGIKGNPSVRPPRPVGLAWTRTGQGAYVSWGHPTGNKYSADDGIAKARQILGTAIDNKEPIVFHNSKFDVAVAEKWLGLKFPDPLLVDDTMFQIFLHDPYATTFALKPSSERILGLPPEERDAVKAWVLSHIACKPSEWGAHIAEVPAHIVAPYAKGDVKRTLALFEHLKDKVPLEAYQREQRLRPIIMAGEQRGVKVNLELLESDMSRYEEALLQSDDRIRSILRDDSCNLDSGEELAEAIARAGLHDGWVLTPTGRRSTARGALEKVITHPELLALLQYRGALAHCLSNFGRPWVALAQEYNGRLHPEWNQVRQERGGNESKGTRTGRLSCSKPNFQNPPNEYNIKYPEGLPELPLMRKYLVPDDGYVWIKRDYSQQELRILAHYSEGRLFERYQEDPTIDAHDETKVLIQEHAGVDMPRKYVKITGFSIIYGSGVGNLSEQLGCSYPEAQHTRDAYFTALPEVPKLMRECSNSGKARIPITTWGGRIYYAEPPKIVKGRYRSYEYKLLNYLIQGSAADCTKEAVIRWDDDPGNGEFLVTVHDEIDGQAPKETWKKDMKKLKKAMNSIEFDVQMLSDGFYGDSWANLKDCD